MNKKILFVIASLIILISLSQVFALTWRHAGIDTMRLDDNGNLNVIGNMTSTYFFGSGKYLTDILKGRWNVSGTNFYPENLDYDVGIGTAIPQNKLNVIGDINATLDIFSGGFVNATTDICIEGGSCLSDAGTGSGDITSVTTSSTPYLLGGSDSGTVNLDFNDSALNATIDSRAYNSWEEIDNGTFAYINEPLWTGNYTAYNDSWSSTYNATYNTWAYNQTIPAMDYADAQDIVFNNSIAAYVNSEDLRFNNSIAAYVNSQDVLFNTTMQNYVDALSLSHFDDDILWTNTFNATGDTRWLGTGDETDPQWSANYTAYNDSWTTTYNATYQTAYEYATNDTYVPYTGAVSNVDLGDNNFTVNGTTFHVDTNTGRVGIGTDNPVSTLDVNGSVKASAVVSTGADYTSGLISGQANVVTYVYRADVNGGTGRLFSYDGSTYYDLAMGSWNGGDADIYLEAGGQVGFHEGNPQYTIDVGGDARVQTDLTIIGNVGIGISSPLEKLHANGSAIINGTLNMDSNKIISLANGTSAQDAVTYSQLQTVNVSATAPETDPYWTGNYTAYNDSWTTTDLEIWNVAGNGTLAYNTTFLNYYTISESNAINTSVNNYILDNNNSVNNYILYTNTTMHNTTGDTRWLTSYSETDPYWTANYTAYNDSWTTTYNVTYHTWAYNQTTPAITYADAQDVVFNNSIAAYVDSENLLFNNSIAAYVNSEDLRFNTTMQNYVDALSLSHFDDDILWTDTFNATGDTRWLGTGDETDPYWTGNYTAYNDSWTSTDTEIWNVIANDTFVPYTGAVSNVDLGAHNLTVDTNVLHVDSSTDRVGIGTDSPNYALDVNGDINLASGKYFRINTNAVLMQSGTVFKFGYISGNSYFQSKTDDSLSLYSDSTVAMHIVGSTKYVGIGTTSPLERLHVNGSAIINGTLNMDSNKIISLANGTSSQDAVTLSQLQAVNISATAPETDPYWSANYTAYNDSWTTTYNATYNTWAYNQTLPAITYADAQDVVFNNSIAAYVNSEDLRFNTSIASYVDSQDILFNTSVKNYVDALSLSHFDDDILWTNTFNATGDTRWLSSSFSETDPYWTGNYTAYNDSWTSTDTEIWNVIANDTYVPYTGSNANVVLGDYNFSVGTSDLFVDASTGNVGIGTDSPSGLLEVYNSGNLQFLLEPGTVEEDPYDLGFDNTARRITMQFPQGGYRQVLQIGDGGSLTGTIFGLGASTDTGSTWSPVLIAKQNGNVGINTSSPKNTLNVVGDGNFTGNVTASWFKGIFNWIIGLTSTNYLSFNGTTLNFDEAALNATIDTRSVTSESDPLWTANWTNVAFTNIHETFNENVTFEKNISVGNDSLFVNSNDNRVGINTSIPANTLEVNGTFKAESNQGSITLDSDGNIMIGI